MKICWDNLEKLIYIGDGAFKNPKTNQRYVESDAVCEGCGEYFLKNKYARTKIFTKKSGRSIKVVMGRFCCRKCFHGAEETRKIKSKWSAGKNNPRYGIKMDDELKNKISELHKESGRYRGNKNNFWKGGGNKFPLYDTYAPHIKFAEDVRRDPDNDIFMQVTCTYCGKWFLPTTRVVIGRVSVLKGYKGIRGESRMYCSPNCKSACPTFQQIKYPKGYKTATSREVQPELRQMVLERDNWTCQYGSCGKTIENSELHCHHITGIEQNPIESADVDNCITFCKKHHKKVHREEGCKYHQLRNKKCNPDIEK